jgi:hypothetical protein
MALLRAGGPADQELARQAAGLSTGQTATQSHAETAAAFALLESGLAGFSS